MTITKESITDTIEGLEQLTNRGIQSVYIDTAIAGLRRLQESLDADPVAGEARFKEERHWSPCTAAHVAMVLDNPADWPNYEVRYLYSAPPAPAVPDKIDIKQAYQYMRSHSLAGCYRDGWNDRSAAMLAQPASQRDQVRADHAEWATATFGNTGPVGPLKHLSKEALEAAEAPEDLHEWADMQFLFWDAQRKAGVTDEQITAAMVEKLKINKARQWPEPKDGEPRFHIKEK